VRPTLNLFGFKTFAPYEPDADAERRGSASRPYPVPMAETDWQRQYREDVRVLGELGVGPRFE
jgi:hypothetical protein